MSRDICVITLTGRLTKDIELKYTQNGFAIGNGSIAVNETKKDSNGEWTEYASFFDINILGKTAENLKPYLNKGQQIAITGRLHQERWQGQDGANKSKIVIIAEIVNLCGGTGNNKQQANTQTNQSYQQANNKQGNYNNQSYSNNQNYNQQQQQYARQQEMSFVDEIPF